jgi:putative membrane protein
MPFAFASADEKFLFLKSKRMKKVFLTGSLALFILAACKKDKDNSNNNVNSTDQTFLTQVASGNKAEIMAGQLAATKATNAGIKAFGQMMVTEHGEAQSDLQRVYASVGQTMPDTVDAEHQALMTRLNSLSGYSFDTAYINSQVKDHQKTLSIFQSEISNGNNDSVQNYANKYLPHIQMHLQKADSLSRSL